MKRDLPIVVDIRGLRDQPLNGSLLFDGERVFFKFDGEERIVSFADLLSIRDAINSFIPKIRTQVGANNNSELADVLACTRKKAA